MVTVKPTNYKDGQTEEITGRRKERISSVKRGGLEEVQNQSFINGIEQIRVSGFDSSGQNSIRANVAFPDGEADPGKILERLKQIEDEYLTYLDTEKQHHETRIEEARNKEIAFRRAVQELQQEIYNLISPSNIDEDE